MFDLFYFISILVAAHVSTSHKYTKDVMGVKDRVQSLSSSPFHFFKPFRLRSLSFLTFINDSRT